MHATLTNRVLVSFASCIALWRGGDIGEWCIFFWYQTSKSIRIKSIFYQIGYRFLYSQYFQNWQYDTISDSSQIKFSILDLKILSAFFLKYFVSFTLFCVLPGASRPWGIQIGEKNQQISATFVFLFKIWEEIKSQGENRDWRLWIKYAPTSLFWKVCK